MMLKFSLKPSRWKYVGCIIYIIVFRTLTLLSHVMFGVYVI